MPFALFPPSLRPPPRSFIGNSVSTFSALAMLERRHRGLWAAYYNGGNLPIAPYLPVHKVGISLSLPAAGCAALAWPGRAPVG